MYVQHTLFSSNLPSSANSANVATNSTNAATSANVATSATSALGSTKPQCRQVWSPPVAFIFKVNVDGAIFAQQKNVRGRSCNTQL